jgi:hypothetical protein
MHLYITLLCLSGLSFEASLGCMEVICSTFRFYQHGNENELRRTLHGACLYKL